MVTWHLTVKLLPAKCHERATLRKLWRQTGNSSLSPAKCWPLLHVIAGISARFSNFAFVLFCYITNHLMTGPSRNQSIISLKSSNWSKSCNWWQKYLDCFQLKVISSGVVSQFKIPFSVNLKAICCTHDTASGICISTSKSREGKILILHCT